MDRRSDDAYKRYYVFMNEVRDYPVANEVPRIVVKRKRYVCTEFSGLDSGYFRNVSFFFSSPSLA